MSTDLFDETKPYSYRCGEKPIFFARLPIMNCGECIVTQSKDGGIRTHYNNGRYLPNTESVYDLISLPIEPKLVQFDVEDIKPGMVFRRKSWTSTWVILSSADTFGVFLALPPNRIDFNNLLANWLVSNDGAVTFGPCGKVAK